MATKLWHVALIAVLLAACARDGSTAPPPPARQGTSQAVNEPALWRLVAASNSPAGPTTSVDELRQRLMRLPAEEIVRVDRDFNQEMARSYSWRVWGAAYLINGGCSDDCFDYFRAWLIMQGRTVFEATLRDPDSLAGYAHLTQPAELEDLLYVTRDAYLKVAGKELDSGFVKNPDLGQGWDFDDKVEMKRRYPRLCQKFGC